ncbi:MAG: NAD(P)-dependent oxidoreductase [Blastocatellia bacterium]
MSRKRILVTGGSGYLGTHIRQYFGAEDLSRRSGQDLSLLEDLSFIKNYDVIIHMAACVNKRADAAEQNFTVNVSGTIKLLEKLSTGQTFIFCSTKDVYGSHIDKYKAVPESCSTDFIGQNAYEWSKLIAEKYAEYYCNNAKARLGIFRLSTVYAPTSQGNSGGFVSFFTRAIAKGEQLQLKMQGEQIRDLLHVNDLAQAFELFINSNQQNSLYNIGGGLANSTTLYQLTQTIAKLVKKSANVVLLDEMVKEQIHYVTDISKLTSELGWQPKIDIESGLRTLLENV